MNFPEKVNFKIIDKQTSKPVENVAVSLQLYAARKNDYFVGPFISDTEGLVSFTRESCLHEIESSKKFYLMDYSSTIGECLPKVTLTVKEPEQVRFAVKEMTENSDLYRKYWDCSESFLKRLASVANDQYISDSFIFEEAQLHQPGPIIIEVRHKPD